MKELQAEATKPRYIHNNIRPSKAKSQTSSTKFRKQAQRIHQGKRVWCFSYSKNIALLWSEDQALFTEECYDSS